MDRNTNIIDCIIPLSRKRDLANVIRMIDRAIGLPIHFILVHDAKDLCSEGECELLNRGSLSATTDVVCGIYGSPGMARNAGMEFLKCQWVIFTDADDELDVFVLAQLVTEIQENSIPDLIVGSYSVADSLSQKIIKRVNAGGTIAFDKIIGELGLWRILFKRSEVENLRFTNLPWAEDQVFFIQFLCKFQSLPNIHFSDRNIYTYFKGHDGQLTLQKGHSSALILSLDYLRKLNFEKTNPQDTACIYGLVLRTILTIYKFFGYRKTLSEWSKFNREVESPINWKIRLRAISKLAKGMIALRLSSTRLGGKRG